MAKKYVLSEQTYQGLRRLLDQQRPETFRAGPAGGNDRPPSAGRAVLVTPLAWDRPAQAYLLQLRLSAAALCFELRGRQVTGTYRIVWPKYKAETEDLRVDWLSHELLEGLQTMDVVPGGTASLGYDYDASYDYSEIPALRSDYLRVSADPIHGLWWVEFLRPWFEEAELPFPDPTPQQLPDRDAFWGPLQMDVQRAFGPLRDEGWQVGAAKLYGNAFLSLNATSAELIIYPTHWLPTFRDWLNDGQLDAANLVTVYPAVPITPGRPIPAGSQVWVQPTAGLGYVVTAAQPRDFSPHSDTVSRISTVADSLKTQETA